MVTHLLAILTLGALCGGWVLLQRWIAKREPEVAKVKRACGACGGGECASASKRSCE
jgi:hypothetical protein